MGGRCSYTLVRRAGRDGLPPLIIISLQAIGEVFLKPGVRAPVLACPWACAKRCVEEGVMSVILGVSGDWVEERLCTPRLCRTLCGLLGAGRSVTLLGAGRSVTLRGPGEGHARTGRFVSVYEGACKATHFLVMFQTMPPRGILALSLLPHLPPPVNHPVLL